MQALAWWQRGIVYEVYPRSFQDSDGDGIGDIQGVRARLDYLVSLGIEGLWVAPIYPSPMADFGYDISDYCNVDPRFGTLADLDALIADVHARGLKLLLDFVPNHTSDQHPWFLESRSSRTNPKRDWYIWHDGAGPASTPEAIPQPPNNWMSNFGGSGWEWDPHTRQFYYHSFLKQQPDVNWRNPHLRAAMLDVLRFWLGRGVDGFRVDVMWLLIKDDQLRDNPANPAADANAPASRRFLPVYNANRPEVHEIVRAMRAVIDSYPDRVLIGEIYLPVQQLVTYYGPDLKGANLPFNFQLIHCAWRADALAAVIQEYEAALPAGAWPNWVLGNHDQSRIASRIGAAQARIAAMLLLTLRGTPTLYYGEEIGMSDLPIPPDEVQDPFEKSEPGLGNGRDPERTPMQWDSTGFAGFTTGPPWLPVNPNHATVNVQTEGGDPASMLRLYQGLTALRASSPALVSGSLEDVRAEGKLLRYRRSSGDQSFLILLNIGDEPLQLASKASEVLLSTRLERKDAAVTGTLTLGANEGVILREKQT